MIPLKQRPVILSVAEEQRSVESPTLDATGATKQVEPTPSLRLTIIDAPATNKAVQLHTVLEQQLSQSPVPSAPAPVSPSRIEAKNSVSQQEGSLMSSEQRAQEPTLEEQQRRIDAAIALQSLDKLITKDASEGVFGEPHGSAVSRKAPTRKAIKEDAEAKLALECATKSSEAEANLEQCRIERLLHEQQRLVGGCPVTPQCQRSSRTTQYQSPFPPPAPIHRFHTFPSVQRARHPQQVTAVGNRFCSAAPMLPMIHGQFAEEQHCFFQRSFARGPSAPQGYHTHNMPPIPFVPNMAATPPRFGYFAQSDECVEFPQKGAKRKGTSGATSSFEPKIVASGTEDQPR